MMKHINLFPLLMSFTICCLSCSDSSNDSILPFNKVESGNPVGNSFIDLDSEDESKVVVDDSGSSPSSSEVPFGIKPHWFSKESPRFRKRISKLTKLPEKVPKEWFKSQPPVIQKRILKMNFIWGKNREGGIVLGVIDSKGRFQFWPTSRNFEWGNARAWDSSLFEYPMTPGIIKFTAVAKF